MLAVLQRTFFFVLYLALCLQPAAQGHQFLTFLLRSNKSITRSPTCNNGVTSLAASEGGAIKQPGVGGEFGTLCDITRGRFSRIQAVLSEIQERESSFFCQFAAPLRQFFSPQSIKVHHSGAALPVYYRSSGRGCRRSVSYQRVNVRRSLLMNPELVLCWEAAWCNICHNTARRRPGEEWQRWGRRGGNRCLLLH